MRFSTTLVAFFAAHATALPAADPLAAEERAAPPDPGQLRIDGLYSLFCRVPLANIHRGLVLSGSGCPQGSVAALLSGDGQIVTIGFDKYIASTGSGILATENRKSCQVFFNLYYPQGWSYTLATTDFRGYIDQDQSCTTNLGVTNFFSGDQNQVCQDTTQST